MRIQLFLGGWALIMSLVSNLPAQPTETANPVSVTADNFIRAESDLYLAGLVKDSGGQLGKFNHRREVADIDHQTVIRLNRDTMYSSAVFDLDAGPVTITLPEAADRFRSMQVINQDHYVPEVSYQSGPHTLAKEKVGTRYAVVAIRTLVDPNNADDVKQVHALQDAIQVDQPGGPGKFEVPQWDAASQKKVRDALLVLSATIPDFRGAFGKQGEVDPVRHLLGSAAAWGGNPDPDAIYLNVTPAKNDGRTVHKLTANDVPVDGFWSISVYNADGYYEKNPLDAYTLNNLTAKKSTDGSITIQFGGCDGNTPNCLPTVPGWNYMVRLYRPRPEILDGSWKFPEAKPIDERADGQVYDEALTGSWVLVELNGKPVAGRDISLEFDSAAGRAVGSTGVNRWGGGYKRSGQSIEFGPLMSTRRAGPPEAMRLEHDFTQALDKVTQFAQDAGRLVLSAEGKPLLVFERGEQQ